VTAFSAPVRFSMGRRLASVIGIVVAGSSLVMLPAAIVALLSREWAVALQITAAALVTAACGTLSWRFLGKPGQLSTKEGFAVVALAWFAVAAFGTLPYLFTGSLTNPTDAFFETAAGFTTTGATVITDLAVPPRGIVFWRALTQWMGGMGFVVLSIAVLPLLGTGGVQLARAESPGPEPDRLTPRFRETARRLWLIYAGITVAAFLLLAAGDMDLFEAGAHALAAVSTGGFGTEPGSIGVFSAYTQWVIVVVMAAAGTSFALHYRALRDPGGYLRHPEFRLYVAFILGAAVLIAIGTWTGGGAAGTIRKAVFSATALVTGTGFVVDDFGRWPETLQILAVGLMFVYPNAVSITRFGRDPVPDQIVRSVQSFFLFYVLALVLGTFLLAALEAGFSSGMDLVTATSAVVSALGNIGPGLGEVGPSGTYAGVSAGGKWLLSFLMVLGRLEIFPVLLLFTRWLWRR
jgi:trk system potassium uptake protein TrkH